MTDHSLAPLPSVLAISEDGYRRLMASLRSGYWTDDDERERDEPETYTIAHGVARVCLHGPLMATADWLDRICGATTYGEFVAALQAAHADPRAQVVLIDVDSPGGDVKGMHEAAMAVRALRGQGKPIVTYASGAMASAGYGVGCQTDRIYASPNALVGCLGTICVGYDDTKFMESLGVTRHVTRSAETPNKAPLPGSPEYEAEAQRVADDTAAVLFADVGAARGVDPVDVPEKYGRGAIYVGARALDAGLVDAIAGPDDTWLYAGGIPPAALMNPGVKTMASSDGAVGAQMYAPGDKIRIKGKPHAEGHAEGTVATSDVTEVLSVDFGNGMPPHKWYIADEVEPADGQPHKKSSQSRAARMLASEATNPGGVRASQEVGTLTDKPVQSSASDTSATAGTPPDTSGSRAVPTVVIEASEHKAQQDELVALRAQRARFEQAEQALVAARTESNVNAQALAKAQTEAAEAKRQADETAKHVAEMRKATALADADAMHAKHAGRGAINAHARTTAMGKLKALGTAEEIAAKAAEQDELFGLNPDGAARPIRTTGATAKPLADGGPQDAAGLSAEAWRIAAAEKIPFGQAWQKALALHPAVAAAIADREVRA